MGGYLISFSIVIILNYMFAEILFLCNKAKYLFTFVILYDII